jgi:hypothetical protein
MNYFRFGYGGDKPGAIRIIGLAAGTYDVCLGSPGAPPCQTATTTSNGLDFDLPAGDNLVFIDKSTPIPTLTPTPTPMPTDTPTLPPPLIPTKAACSIPALVTGQNPTGTAACGLTSLTFRWNSVAGATNYAIRVDENPVSWSGTCSSINPGDTCIDNLITTSYTRSVVPGRTYRWWVHAINSCGWSSANLYNVTVPLCPKSTPTPTPTSTKVFIPPPVLK